METEDDLTISEARPVRAERTKKRLKEKKSAPVSLSAHPSWRREDRFQLSEVLGIGGCYKTKMAGPALQAG
jgi:hypothetical protein